MEEVKTADYIIFVGWYKEFARPEASAFTKEEAIQKAEEYAKTKNYVQVVYMPEADIDQNDTILEIVGGAVIRGN